MSYSEGDIGGNQGDGLLAYGVAASGSNTGILIGNNIGQNQRNDVELIGTDGLGGCLGAYGWTIQGNNITGSGSKAKNNTYDNIKLTNDCYESLRRLQLRARLGRLWHHRDDFSLTDLTMQVFRSGFLKSDSPGTSRDVGSEAAVEGADGGVRYISPTSADSRACGD